MVATAIGVTGEMVRIDRTGWIVPPDEVAWRLPDSYALQRLLVDAVSVRLPFGPLARQLSSTRRAA